MTPADGVSSAQGRVRAVPQAAERMGFTFTDPQLDAALRAIFNRPVQAAPKSRIIRAA